MTVVPAVVRQMPAVSGLPGQDSAEGQEPGVREQWPVAASVVFVEPPVCAAFLVLQSVPGLLVLLAGSELSVAARLPGLPVCAAVPGPAVFQALLVPPALV